MGTLRMCTKVYMKSMKERDMLKDLVVDGKIILK
jgi:hypothetical protein